MRIYTRSGDKGTTSLVYGKRVRKDDIRVDAYGTCDEANSMIGLAVSYLTKETFEEKSEALNFLHKVQTILFHVGAELATPSDKEVYWKLSQEHLDELEAKIDQWSKDLPELKQFILPGGTAGGSTLHVARTIIRRAERLAVKIDDDVNPLVLSYLNRLSDFLFVAGRFVNHKMNEKESILHENP